MEGLASRAGAALACALFLSFTSFSQAACTGCTFFQDGVALGIVANNAVTDASGIAASRRNFGVLWIVNDGSDSTIFAVTTNGVPLATFDHSKNMDDVEDMAVGPGPSNGVSYIYVGDIGGNVNTNNTRSTVKIVRAEEPFVDFAWASNPRFVDLDADSFTLVYPDGSYDAESLMVDPLTADIYVVTKQENISRIYRANVNNATNRQTIAMQFVRTVDYNEASAADISPDGTQIIFRRENSARIWQRCDNEPIADAFNRASNSVPVIERPIEPNGEGLAFLPDGSGYVTISDSMTNPVIYFFQAICPRAPFFVAVPTNQVSVFGGSVRIIGAAGGYPPPVYTWSHNGGTLAGQTGPALELSNLGPGSAGSYTVRAENAHGSVVASMSLTVRAKPLLRITEVMPAQVSSLGVPSGDWWELTSFESQPVNLTGWRFNDNGGGLTDPFVISNSLVIAPGESIIFGEDLTATEFVSWWGSFQLPVGLKVVRYSGAGLSLGANGDGLRLWDSLATDVNDTVASVDFGPATNGISFNYNPLTQQFGGLSQLGVNGVIQAALSADIGSPGRITTPPKPFALVCRLQGNSVRIEFDAAAQRLYRLEIRNSMTANWSDTGDSFKHPENTRGFFVRPIIPGAARFFRVKAD